MDMCPGHILASTKGIDMKHERFIDLWEWEEGQCTMTIILPCICIELFPLNSVCVIVRACMRNILENTKGIEMKLGLYIDISERQCRAHEP